MNIHIRWMIRRDMEEVLDIEQQCFGQHAWSEDDYMNMVKRRNCIGMVAEHDEKIVGVMIYELEKHCLRLRTLSVMPKYFRQGIGRQMIKKLTDKLSQQRRSKIITEVRETNLFAQLFFQAMGFRATKIVKEFYKDVTDDAYVMEYTVNKIHQIFTNRISEALQQEFQS